MNDSESTVESLAERFRDGESNLRDKLIVALEPMVIAGARFHGRDIKPIQDAEQQALCEMLLTIDKLQDVKPDDPVGYVLLSVKNCMRHMTENSQMIPVPLRTKIRHDIRIRTVEHDMDMIGSGGQSYRIGELLETLDSESRELVLQYLGGLNVRDLAKLTGVSKSTAHRKLQAALNQLWYELADDFYF